MALNFRNSLNLFKHLPKSNFNRLPVAVVSSRNYFLNSLRISNSNVLQNGLCSRLSSPPSSINLPQREFHLLKRLTPEVVDTLFAKNSTNINCFKILNIKTTPIRNEIVSKDTQRSLVQYGIRGRRKTVKAVLRRFYRLNWKTLALIVKEFLVYKKEPLFVDARNYFTVGANVFLLKTDATTVTRLYPEGIWIHPRTGRHNKLWKKSLERKKRSRTHVFCNATQTFMLDKMVCRYWKKKKYYVDDPYENYQTRPEFWITHRR